MTNNYTVRWEINISAESPEDAAKQALTIMQDKESTATVFTCYKDNLIPYTIDLSKEEA